jgi:ABC-2 type transport system permease protein
MTAHTVRAIWAMAVNDLRLLMRDKGAMFFTFVFPALLAIFFGMVFGGGGPGSDLPITVVNEDRSPMAAAFVDDLKRSKGVVVTEMADRAAGEAAIREGKVIACVVVPDGFGDAGQALMTGKSATLEMMTDPTRTSEAGLLTGRLNELAFKRIFSGFTDPTQLLSLLDKGRETLSKTDDPEQRRVFGSLLDSLDLFGRDLKKWDDEQAGKGADDGKAGTKKDDGFAFNPLVIKTSEVAKGGAMPRKSFEFTFPQGVVWGLMGCVTAFGSALAAERQRGTLLRLSTAPISRGAIIAGKALGCFMACVIVQALLLAMAMLFFGVRVSSWPVMITAVLFSSLGFVGIMMALAGMSKTEGGAGGMGRAVVIILAMIGGGTIPLFILPPLIQKISSVSPFKWALISFEGGLWREFTMSQMLVPCGAMLAFGVVGFVVGTLSFRWADAK